MERTSASSTLASRVIKEGYLLKKNHESKKITLGLKYKMRWFELSKDTLVYCATSESLRDVNAKIRVFGVHELVWVKKMRGTKLELKFPERILMVRAQTVKDADQWQEALERAKAAGQDEGAAQGSGTKVPAGLESLRKSVVAELLQEDQPEAGSPRIASPGLAPARASGSSGGRAPALSLAGLPLPEVGPAPGGRPPSPRSLLANPRMATAVLGSGAAKAGSGGGAGGGGGRQGVRFAAEEDNDSREYDVESEGSGMISGESSAEPVPRFRLVRGTISRSELRVSMTEAPSCEGPIMEGEEGEEGEGEAAAGKAGPATGQRPLQGTFLMAGAPAAPAARLQQGKPSPQQPAAAAAPAAEPEDESTDEEDILFIEPAPGVARPGSGSSTSSYSAAGALGSSRPGSGTSAQGSRLASSRPGPYYQAPAPPLDRPHSGTYSSPPVASPHPPASGSPTHRAHPPPIAARPPAAIHTSSSSSPASPHSPLVPRPPSEPAPGSPARPAPPAGAPCGRPGAAPAPRRRILTSTAPGSPSGSFSSQGSASSFSRPPPTSRPGSGQQVQGMSHSSSAQAMSEGSRQRSRLTAGSDDLQELSAISTPGASSAPGAGEVAGGKVVAPGAGGSGAGRQPPAAARMRAPAAGGATDSNWLDEDWDE